VSVDPINTSESEIRTVKEELNSKSLTLISC
jgi:hypothetical protein